MICSIMFSRMQLYFQNINSSLVVSKIIAYRDHHSYRFLAQSIATKPQCRGHGHTNHTDDGQCRQLCIKRPWTHNKYMTKHWIYIHPGGLFSSKSSVSYWWAHKCVSTDDGQCRQLRLKRPCTHDKYMTKHWIYMRLRGPLFLLTMVSEPGLSWGYK